MGIRDWRGSYHAPVTSDKIEPYLGRGSAGNLPYCPLDSSKTFDTSYTIVNTSTAPTCNIGNDPDFKHEMPPTAN